MKKKSRPKAKMPKSKASSRPVAPARSTGRKGKDAGIAAILSVAGMILLGAPAIGYFYIGQIRKGFAYLIASWFCAAAIVALSVFLGFITQGVGFFCIAPVGLLLLAFDLVIVYDVYLCASGQKPKLPDI